MSEKELLTGDEEVWPSIDATAPSEEGGPIARAGFNYQDEIAVGFVLEMLANPQLVKIHFETHDDLVLVWDIGAPARIAEFVQVKGSEADKLWSVADLCSRKKQAVGSSIFEKSLDRDQHDETARFRIVTLRPVVSPLKPLTYELGHAARALSCEEMIALKSDLDTRMPSVLSKRGHGTGYWLDNCLWDERHDEPTVKEKNKVRLFEITKAAGHPLLWEHLDLLLDELRKLVKSAGDAKWKPDKEKKILTREAFLLKWDACLAKLQEAASQPSGGKLAEKMKDAALTGTVVAMAIDMRLDYARFVRTARYMQPDEAEQLQGRVKSEAQTLSAKRAAGTLDLDGPAFHALCVDRMDAIPQRAGN